MGDCVRQRRGRRAMGAAVSSIGDNKDDGKSLVQYMGKKQVLKTVESNCLVGEFCWVTRLISE